MTRNKHTIKSESKGADMTGVALLLLSILLIGGCSKDGAEEKRVSQNAVEPDNTGRNVRDRDGQNKTPEDQSESEADREISKNIRAALTSDDSLSTNGKNVKIITNDGTVTLRGPVKNDAEKSQIEAKAKQAAGVKKVENQLEIAS
jgi:hyperosmotically inducible periplasmic protein